MSGILNAIKTSATGLTLQRKKMDAVAENIANAETTRTEKGGPYRRKRVTVSEAVENTPFKTIMARTGTKLAQTNPRHMSGNRKSLNEEAEISKVKGRTVEDSASGYRLVHDPGHPDADEQGFVRLPDIEIVTEMVDMMAASRAYEANTVAILTSKEMAKDALEI